VDETALAAFCGYSGDRAKASDKHRERMRADVPQRAPFLAARARQRTRTRRESLATWRRACRLTTWRASEAGNQSFHAAALPIA